MLIGGTGACGGDGSVAGGVPNDGGRGGGGGAGGGADDTPDDCPDETVPLPSPLPPPPLMESANKSGSISLSSNGWKS